MLHCRSPEGITMQLLLRLIAGLFILILTASAFFETKIITSGSHLRIDVVEVY